MNLIEGSRGYYVYVDILAKLEKAYALGLTPRYVFIGTDTLSELRSAFMVLTDDITYIHGLEVIRVNKGRFVHVA